ncbi:P-loop containing nucleoside triphosphate hydrolase protein [Lindgomyces ingoldianus]|uniref:P-loop containing nucleoside triphosphate hydrolase protein n=1 Tax=Lindgomyces ingoldianus TaxID=673940 RepID=A0ACB6RHJ1_9PLEO|nr:P-loop containing nucleoside triphosphate hydrolase protein [Lindgomyces ingoldianus]KAF2478195.1 P-loop containing nucleoside triphosphate hydrolase protein [Lindgomyces ingoldianus]
MAKKKKPAANPARGFATTSVASKPKQEKVVGADAKEPNKERVTPLSQTPQITVDPQPQSKEVVQTPEELEAQLEHDGLQLLVEKHASKTRREFRRQVSKIHTDRRTLRPQSEIMSVRDWLSSDVLDNVIALAQEESNDPNRRLGQKSLLKVLPEEDGISKLWTLDLVLRELGFTHVNIQLVMKWLCANAVNIDSTASIWGFQEGLEWLALDQCEGHAFSYEEPKTKRFLTNSQSTSRPGTPISSLEMREPARDSDHETSTNPTSNLATPSILTPAESDHSDVSVSDLDSDIEPDQLVPTYLKIKGKLFEIDPDHLEYRSRKQAKASKGKKLPPSKKFNPTAVQKLESQLKQLESDGLFDQYDADVQWPALRNRIAQNNANDKRPQLPESAQPSQSDNGSSTALVPTDSQVEDPESDPHGLFLDEESSLLGDMFTAIPDDASKAGAESRSSPSSTTMLKDFGKQSGMAPRKLLEETVRARDSHAKLSYKLISETAYSCRHEMTVKWSRDQDIIYEEDMPGIECTVQNLWVVFRALTVSTVSVEQSESFIATAALFSMFCSSPREEKAHLRLPSNWRDLYKDFLEHRQKRLDSADRNTIKHLRSIIQDQVDHEESDGVVLTSRFKMRSQPNTASSVASKSTPASSQLSENLRSSWIQKSTTPSYQRMHFTRATLPVFEFRNAILSTIKQHQVTIICGETGCGKSTQIPSFILEHELSKGMPCKIFCTEPRRISAISLAQRVSEELGEGPRDLGTPRSFIGYAIRLESKTTAQTRLVYATVGVVLRMLESSGGLSDLTHLIIDEVHERNIDTDFLLIILRSLMVLRPELKVILMSATVDAQRFSKYLNDAPILNIPGRTYPVRTKYLEDAIEFTHYDAASEDKLDDSETSGNEEEGLKEKSGIPSKLPGYSSATRNVLSSYNEYAIDYDLILRLIEAVAYDEQFSRYSNAFLIFLPGIAEIRQVNDMLTGHPSFDRNWLIYPLHSTISSDDQQAAFLLPPPGVRKIVLATNIAETGVTIPDITCVIDTGKHKEMRFDERRQLSRLTQSFISRANAKQRRGRAGRVQEGLCFHLFTKYRHDNLMTDQQTPEMLRLSLQDLIMRTKICKLGDIEKTLSEALDPPSSRNIRRAIDALKEVDALTASEELTHLGRQLAKLPLDAHLGKLVLLSSVYGCVDVAITIAAILSSKSPFLTPFGSKQRADAARFAFKKGESDLLTAYNAYKTWKTVCTTPGRSEMQFCHKNFLSSQNLGNVEDLKAQLLSSLFDAGFVQLSPEECRALSRYRSTNRQRMFVSVPTQYDINSNNDILVNSVVATAFYPKILIREGKGWRNISNNQTVSLAPTSVNKVTSINSSSAKYLSYYHIMQSSNKFYNAHSTSIAHSLPMVIMVGADMDFKLHAGVISFPGNVLKFAVKDWRVAVALKVLRRRIKEIVSASWKNPGRQMSGREKEWMRLLFEMFDRQQDKAEGIKRKT